LPQVSDFLNFPGEQRLFVSVEQVVRQAIASLKADRPLVIPGLAMKFAMRVSRRMPMQVLRWLFRLSLRQTRCVVSLLKAFVRKLGRGG